MAPPGDPAASSEPTSANESRGALADDFAALRRLCAEESYELPVPERVDRPAPSLGQESGILPGVAE